MTFWLDDPSRRSSYIVADFDLESEKDRIEPAIIHTALPRHRRRLRPALIISGAAAAAAINVVVGFLVIWSSEKARPSIAAISEPAAMFASLTPASSISAAPSDQPPAAAQTTSDDSGALIYDDDAPSDVRSIAQAAASPATQSADLDEALLNTSRQAAADVTPSHADADNPWAHASAPVHVLTSEEKLWAAIKPCLKSKGDGPLPIWLVFDKNGRVERMTNVEGDDAQADPALQALVHAVHACEPYDYLVKSAHSYLVVASG